MIYRNLLNFWTKLSPLTRNLTIFVLVNIVLINLVIAPALPPIGEISKDGYTLTQNLKQFLSFKAGTDSWKPMLSAYDFFETESQEPLYAKVFFNENVKFQYPPTSLLVIFPLKAGPIGSILKAMDISLDGIFKGISWLFVLVIAFVSLRIFNHSVNDQDNETLKATSTADSVIRNALLFCLALSFYPVIKAYTLGQIQAWLNAIVAIIVWLWINDQKRISGFLAGALCLVKPQYSLILLWGILRRQWSFVVPFIVTALIGLALSVVLFGFANHLDYLSVLSFISRRGEGFYPNQSFNGLLNRFLANGNNLFWEENSFPPFNSVVYYGTVLSSLVLTGLALVPPSNPRVRGSTTDLLIMTLTSTIASPVAWEHHYGVLLPIYAYLLPGVLKFSMSAKGLLTLLAFSYLLTSNFLPFVNHLAFFPFSMNILQSYLFLGALIVLWLLYHVQNSASTKQKPAPI